VLWIGIVLILIRIRIWIRISFLMPMPIQMRIRIGIKTTLIQLRILTYLKFFTCWKILKFCLHSQQCQSTLVSPSRQSCRLIYFHILDQCCGSRSRIRDRVFFTPVSGILIKNEKNPQPRSEIKILYRKLLIIFSGLKILKFVSQFSIAEPDLGSRINIPDP
jgi:hypothetical protein